MLSRMRSSTARSAGSLGSALAMPQMPHMRSVLVRPVSVSGGGCRLAARHGRTARGRAPLVQYPVGNRLPGPALDRRPNGRAVPAAPECLAEAVAQLGRVVRVVHQTAGPLGKHALRLADAAD